ncbi:MAG: antitoxin MazE family protein [Devosia sp.]
MGTPVNKRVQKRRDALRAQGLRPVQIWALDTRSPEFIAEARRQSRIVAAADAEDRELRKFMDAALDDALAELEDDEILVDRPGEQK